jgi:hypothetical protein
MARAVGLGRRAVVVVIIEISLPGIARPGVIASRAGDDKRGPARFNRH